MTTEKQLTIPLTLERAESDAEALTIPVSFASDNLVADPYLGPVELSMDPSAVDLTLAADRGIPVHEMHRRAVPIGRVTDIQLDGNRLRGVMRFSANPRGRELYRDAQDGILTDTSVGASIYAIREEADRIVAINWRPREVSLVDEGADQSVGINRAKAQTPSSARETQNEENSMTAEHQQESVDTQRSAAKPNTPAVETASVSRDEINIRELGDYAHKRAPELGIDRMRDDFIAFGKPYEEFRGEVWRMLRERQDAQPGVSSPSELGLVRAEVQEFSIVRAAHAFLTNNWKKAGFELECSRAVAERLGRDAKGFYVPLEVQRDLAAGTPAAGGTLVGTDHRGDLFIDALRARSVAMAAGVQMLPGLVGNVSIPKLTGSATFYWLNEDEDVTDSDPSTGAVTLTPHTVAGAVPMTRKLLMQSSPSVEQMVRNDLISGIALAIDLAVFDGDNVKEPMGILNAAGVGTVTITAPGVPDWLEVLQYEAALETANALDGALSWVTTPGVRAQMKGTPKDSGSGIFICSEGNVVNGYSARTSTQLPANTLLFGDFSQVIVGQWGVLDVKPDEAAKAASGGLVLRVFQDCDVAIRHAESFAKNA
jgi:HK97 family phage major capsid protein